MIQLNHLETRNPGVSPALCVPGAVWGRPEGRPGEAGAASHSSTCPDPARMAGRPRDPLSPSHTHTPAHSHSTRTHGCSQRLPRVAHTITHTAPDRPPCSHPRRRRSLAAPSPGHDLGTGPFPEAAPVAPAALPLLGGHGGQHLRQGARAAAGPPPPPRLR